jgi:hypothetical protein
MRRTGSQNVGYRVLEGYERLERKEKWTGEKDEFEEVFKEASWKQERRKVSCHNCLQP